MCNDYFLDPPRRDELLRLISEAPNAWPIPRWERRPRGLQQLEFVQAEIQTGDEEESEEESEPEDEKENRVPLDEGQEGLVGPTSPPLRA